MYHDKQCYNQIPGTCSWTHVGQHLRTDISMKPISRLCPRNRKAGRRPQTLPQVKDKGQTPSNSHSQLDKAPSSSLSSDHRTPGAHREQAEKRPQGLPDKPQRRLPGNTAPGNTAPHLEGKLPFNQREEAAQQVHQAWGLRATTAWRTSLTTAEGAVLLSRRGGPR